MADLGELEETVERMDLVADRLREILREKEGEDGKNKSAHQI